LSIQYVVDDSGKPVRVLLDVREYEELLERAEDAEALAMLQKMKKRPTKYVKLSEALADLRIDV
jgi:hypothetical protein